MKDIEKIKFSFGSQIKHLANEIFVHHSAYTRKILKRFYMNKTHSLNTQMQLCSLDVKKNIFRPQDDNEELLG